jgi:hypothetical protein
MIAWPAKTQIWVAAGVTDLRRGFTGLSAQVQTKLEQSPFSGHVFLFRGRRGDLIGDDRSGRGIRSYQCNERDSFHNFFVRAADENV